MLLGYCYLPSALCTPTALQTIEVTAWALNKMQHLMRGMVAQDDSQQKETVLKTCIKTVKEETYLMCSQIISYYF